MYQNRFIISFGVDIPTGIYSKRVKGKIFYIKDIQDKEIISTENIEEAKEMSWFHGLLHNLGDYEITYPIEIKSINTPEQKLLNERNI